MAETIRDVVVKLKLTQERAALKAPDTSEFERSLANIRNEIASLGKMPGTAGAEKAFEGFTQASLDLPKKLKDVEDAAVKAIDELEAFDKIAAAVDPLNKKIGELEDEIGDLRSELDDLADSPRKVADEFEDTRKSITDNSLKAAEGFKMAGEGAFTLARGIAFVSTSGDEDLRKMIETIAKVQGAFDLFRGATDTIKGVREGLTALRAAQAASAVAASNQAAANVGLATTNTAVATTATSAATASRGLMVALGPIGIALAAVGAAFLIFRKGSDDVDDATEALKRQDRVLSGLADKFASVRLTQVELFDLEDKRIKLAGEAIDVQARIADIEADRLERGKEAAADLGSELRKLGSITPEFGQELIQKGTVEDITKLADTVRERLKGGISFGQLGLGDDLEILEAEKAVTDDLLETSKSRLTLLERERQLGDDKIAAAKEELDLLRKQVSASEDKAKAAQMALLTAQERFGMLDAEERLEARRIAERIEQAPDKVGFEELKRFEQLVGGQRAKSLVQAEALERAEGAGFDVVSRVGGFQEEVREAERLRDEMRELADVETDLARETVDTLKELRDKNKKAQEEELSLLRDITADQRRRNEQLRKLRDDFRDAQEKGDR